jgi:putative peptide maturation dehydrogenase
MKLRRPAILLVEHRESPAVTLESLLSNDEPLGPGNQWLALAPHLGREVAVELEDLRVLDALLVDQSVEYEFLAARFGTARVDRLIEAGLLIGDHPEHRELRIREQSLRNTAWWGPAAVAHSFGRWQGVDVTANEADEGSPRLRQLVEAHGSPPAEVMQLRPPDSWQPLPAPTRTALDDLLEARATCRNFAPEFVLPLADLASVLHRVFGAQATQALAAGAVALKKNSPSGGGLHPVEAFLLVQRVAGLAPGLYHYHSVAHALVPLQPMSVQALAPLARELVAGQDWFANPPVQVLMAARFQRNFWKYRNHPKAWRVIQLDAGHLSQNLYLSATELGYGAFVTGAINDECAERLFGFDGLEIGAIAACGFGRRARERITSEFDPLGKAAC